MTTTLRSHAVGVTWVEQNAMGRAAHAVLSGKSVWLIDPFEDQPALRAASSLGRPAGVLQLLDRHNRDCESIASRLGVPLYRVPVQAPETPFEFIPIVSRAKWREVALWWQDARTLIVAEAIGTSPPFALGRRAGVNPLLRLMPPRAALSRFHPDLLLVGHGEPIESGATEALDDALAKSRSDILLLPLTIPKLLLRR